MSRTRALVLLAVLASVTACKPLVEAQPTTAAPPVAPAEARTQLAALKIAVRGTLDGYSREKFPHWDDVDGACDTREQVLKRDGKDVTTNSDCAPKSGTWLSPYDGKTWSKASDVDIDHLVPLAQAWVSGAKAWTQQRREHFANDLVRPQLHAVTDNLNEQKGDKEPDQWKPPLVSYWCTYATDWIVVKRNYGLTITVPEKTALETMLSRC
ncbi:GmrSD restriction endonuclease domain-containing protein [Amycolatopsis nalaikhensis]|uniref:DUF1524 domain-containing protein n=1 Tax=Amycolatopsis nalaikhensis TaxID=715472 RepID=A0ABY8XHQ6_9PSEU|nr:DUF1524 domain-containing protein [Amycolatopsis sp. 2-2]WIV55149.1 DUF1524 domain-containing protein [Amycolatopsis sp. 2-2]